MRKVRCGDILFSVVPREDVLPTQRMNAGFSSMMSTPHAACRPGKNMFFRIQGLCHVVIRDRGGSRLADERGGARNHNQRCDSRLSQHAAKPERDRQPVRSLPLGPGGNRWQTVSASFRKPLEPTL
jgi:hypothetical protein